MYTNDTFLESLPISEALESVVNKNSKRGFITKRLYISPEYFAKIAYLDIDGLKNISVWQDNTLTGRNVRSMLIKSKSREEIDNAH